MARLGGATAAVGEFIALSVDFASVAAGGPITLGSVKAFDQFGADVTSTIIAATPIPTVIGTVVSFYVNGGSVQATYYVSVTVGTTATGEVREGGIELTIDRF